MTFATFVRRRGVSAVETAIVLSVLMVLMCGMIIGGSGVFRHQQVQCLACEGARWASVRSGEYQKETGAAPTKQQIIDQAILPKAVGMNASDITVQVEWIDKSTNTATDWDAATKDIRSVASTGEYVSNTVRVTVSFQWTPGMFWGATTVRNVCELPLSN